MAPSEDGAARLQASRRIRLTVRYDGSEFHGWQKQEPPDSPEPLRTAQGVLETAVRRAVREPVQVLGASRTDAGVHAHGQVAAFTMRLNQTIPVARLHLAINKFLPDDIAVVNAAPAHPEFDPIRDCVCKTYVYRLHTAPLRPVFERQFLYHCSRPVDIGRMDRAARQLVGEHDFVSFANSHHGRESTVRTVYRCEVRRISEVHAQIEITGNGFLYHMVRIIAGTLVEIGRGRLDEDCIPALLAARSRSAAGPTLGPEGLCLMNVEYPLSEPGA